MIEKLKRAVHIDFHTMPGIYDFGKGFDAADFAETLSDAHVTLINMFAQCNLGFSYYPTKIGKPYPFMQDDMFGSVLEECHKKDIRVVAYINVGLNHEAARCHAEWVRVDSEGRIIRGDRTANFFRTMCYNTGYGDYLLELVGEILAYDIDGLFCDCMTLESCWCNTCSEDMIARGIDITDRSAVTAFSHEVMLDISRKIRALVPQDKLFYLNGMGYDDVDTLDTHIEVECLPSGGWGYDYFVPRASYARNLHENTLYMTGRFQASWGDFGGFKSMASLENDVYDALCQGIQVSVGDHMHPARGLEKDIYRIIGEIYGKTMRYETWTDSAKYKADIGIVINRGSYGAEQPGAARMLSELKYSFEIINEDMPLEDFKLIILPDETAVNDRLLPKLNAYMQSGGCLLSSGFGGMTAGRGGFAQGYYDFIEYCGADTNNASYYRTKQKICEADMDYDMYVQGILMKSDSSFCAASYVKAYFNHHWDGFHGYFYTPPERDNGYAAAAVCGNTAHICFKIFTAYSRTASVFHKKLVGSLINRLLPDPLIRAPGMPSTSRVTMTGTDTYSLLHVKTTFPEPRGPFDIIEEHVVLPVGRHVSVRGEYSCVCLLPEETPVPFEVKDSRTDIILPEITGYAMFLLT